MMHRFDPTRFVRRTTSRFVLFGVIVALGFSSLSNVTLGVTPAGATTLSQLSPGSQINLGDAIVSANGTYELTITSTGALKVLTISSGATKWNAGVTGGSYLQLRPRGNLILFNSAGTRLWASGSDGTHATSLSVSNSGVASITGANGVTWSTSAGNVLNNAIANVVPMQSNELFGGGSSEQLCATCTPAGLKTVSGGQSTKPGEPVGPVLGDYVASKNLFSIPGIDGNLEMSLSYDSALAIQQREQAATPTGFGYGWNSSLTASISVDSSGNVATNDANTGQSYFSVDPGGATCPSGGASSYLKYTISTSNVDYCAARRVDAQLGHSATYGYYQINKSGGKAISIYTAFGDLAYQGKISTTGTVAWNFNVAPGSGPCPSTWGGLCVTATDGAGRVMWAKEAFGLYTSVTDPMGRTYGFSYDTSGTNINLTSITSPAPASSGTVTASFTYGMSSWPNNSNMTKNTDSAGRAQQISYGSGMVSSVVDPMGTHTTSYSYSNANCQLWNNSSGGLATSASSSNVLSTSAKNCSTGNQTTTVSYPDAEIDVNSYSNSQLIATSFGASATASSADTESWSFFYVQASTAGQDDAVTQTVVGPTDAGVAPSSQPAILVVDVAGDLTSFTDPNGNTTTAAYNDLGGNNRHELCWSASPGTSLTSTPSCPATSTGVPGFSSFVYDSVGNLVASVDQAGSITRNSYSSTTGLRCWTTPPSVSTASTSCSSVPTGATRYTYSNRGDLKSTTVGYGTTAPSVSTSTYNDDGQVTCTLPPNGQAGAACGAGSNPYATTYSYFTNGSIQTITPPSPAGASSYTYDGAGNVLTIKQVTTPARITTNKYDANGRLCWTFTASTTSSNACSSPPAGASLVENSYLADTTAPTQETDASGKVTNFTYGDARFPTQATKSVTSSGSNPSTLYSSFDPYGNTCVSGPVATTVASCSGVAGDTSSQYAAGDSAYPVQTSTTNADGGVTTTFFDDQGQLIATTGPSGNPTTCDPTTSSVPCADTVANQYDTAGRLTCSFEPNLANNTCASPGSGAGVIRYSYTSTGQRASMVDATGTTSYSYDAFDRLIKVVDGLGATITYGYDANSNLTCLTYPSASTGSWCPSNGGTGTGPGTVSYTYGTNGQVSAVGDWAGNSFSLNYDVNGDLTGVSANAGAVGIANAYTPTSLLSSIAVTASSGTSNLVSFSISRNQGGLGTIASVTPTLGTTAMATDSFTYTPSSQVASGPIGASSGSNGYAYSTSGNILQGANQFATATYSQANGNGHLCWTSPSISTNGCNLAPSGSTTYSYNADGQRTGASPSTGNPSTYAWDSARGTLICVNTSGTTCTGPGTNSTSYSYNGDNLRMSATSGSGSSTFAWNSAESIPQLLSDATSSFVYLPGTNVPLEQISGSGSTITSDLLITGANSEVRGLVQLQGSPSLQNKLVNYTDYDAYGNPITASGGVAEPGGVGSAQTSINSNFVGTTPFGFGGGYTDPTGLIYLIARYYDPGSAQFISQDPLPTGVKDYSYSGNDPVNSSDLSGLFSISFGWFIYLHWTHSDIHSLWWAITTSTVSTAVGFVCQMIPLANPLLAALRAACSIGIAVVFVRGGEIFERAYNRGGGIILKFGSIYPYPYYGYSFVGNNWR